MSGVTLFLLFRTFVRLLSYFFPKNNQIIFMRMYHSNENLVSHAKLGSSLNVFCFVFRSSEHTTFSSILLLLLLYCCFTSTVNI